MMPNTKCRQPKPSPNQRPGLSRVYHAAQPRQINAAPSQRKKMGAKKLTDHNPHPYNKSHGPARNSKLPALNRPRLQKMPAAPGPSRALKAVRAMGVHKIGRA